MARRNSVEPPRFHLITAENIKMPRRRSIAVDNMDILIYDRLDVSPRKLPDIFQGRDQRKKSVVERMVHQQIEYSDKLIGRARPRRASLSHVIPVKDAACRAEKVPDAVETARKMMNGLYKRRLSNEKNKDINVEHGLVSGVRRLSIQTDESVNYNIYHRSGRRQSVLFAREASRASLEDNTDFLSRSSEITIPLIKLSSPSDDAPSLSSRDRSNSPISGRSEGSGHKTTYSRHLSPIDTRHKSKSELDLTTKGINSDKTSATSKGGFQRSRSFSPSYSSTHVHIDPHLLAHDIDMNLNKKICNRSVDSSSKSPDTSKRTPSPGEKKGGNTATGVKVNNDSNSVSKKPNSNNRGYGGTQTAARIKHRHAHTEKLQKLLKDLEQDMPMQAKLKLQELRKELSYTDTGDAT